MPAYRSKRGDVRLAVRVTHRVTLDELMHALYASSEETGVILARREVRAAVANQLKGCGQANLLAAMDLADKDDDPERLSWARWMICKAYGSDFEPEFRAELDDFFAPIADKEV